MEPQAVPARASAAAIMSRGCCLAVLLFAWAGWLLFRTRVHFRVWHDHRSMPLLLGLVLVSAFIWLSENIGTFTKIWLYPSQRLGWSMVSIDKLGSWFLLLIISYTLVSLVNAPQQKRRDEHAAPRPALRSCVRGSSPSAAG